jgi:hypothetical protein
MKSKITPFIILLIAVLTCNGQNFTPIEINDAQGVYNGEAIWFDFDNDDDLDFIITGQSNTNDLHTRIYQNNGDDSFELFTVIGGYSETGLELMNINGDEFIDLIINGRKIGAGSDPTSVYLNNSTSFEIENSNVDFLLGGTFASVLAMDWSNDMREDLIISGINGFVDGNPNIETKFYSRDENNDLVSSSHIIGGAYSSSMKLFDIDNDMDLDLIISGNDGESPYQRTDVYIKEENNFVLSDISLEPLQNTSIDIGDYNSDGYMDVILIGYNEFLRDTTLLYKNVGGDFIGVENSGLNGHLGRSGSVQWGDYDNDGDLDLLFHGESSGDWSFEIMINDGNDQFSHLDEENFQNLAYGSASWGDYDNDGDLDILTTGYVDINDPQLIIYRNDLATPNTPPSVPNNLITNSFELNNVDISWDNSSDNETISDALTYNLHVEDAAANIIFSSYSNLETGFLKRIWKGNMGTSNNWNFNNLENGQYTAFVQSIDAGYRTSQFSDSSIFYIGLPNPPESLSLDDMDNLQLTWEDASNNEEFFIIERKIDEEVAFMKFDSVSADLESFTDTKLPPSFSVEYRTQSSNPNGVSGYSSTVSTTIDGTPTELNVILDSGGAFIDWVDNAINEEYYIIERKMDVEEFFTKLDSVTSDLTTFQDTTLPPSFTVNYQLQASNSYGVSDYSSTISTTIDGTPTELNIILDSSGASIEWTDNAINEEYYIIERKMDTDEFFTKLDSVTSDLSTFQDTSLPPSFTVNYKLQASNSYGISDYSSIVSTTIDGTPTELNVSKSLNGISLEWIDNSVTEEYFIIERKLSGSDSFVKIDSVGSNIIEFVDTDDLEDEVRYRVYSKNELGVSDYSEEVSIIILGTDSEHLNMLKIYPNPFKESFTLSTDAINIKDSQIQIFDSQGKLVQFTAKVINEDEMKIRLNSVSKVNFIVIKNDNKVLSFKVLKR